MNDDIFYGTTDGVGPDSDHLMHALLEADPVPEHDQNFWAQLDSEIHETATKQPMRPHRRQRRRRRGGAGGGTSMAPYLVAALVVGLAALGGAYQWIRAGEQRVTMDTSPVEQPEDPQLQNPQPVELGPEVGAVDPTLIPTPIGVPADTTALSPDFPAPPLDDGSWRIAPGRALGVTADGESAWVRTLSPTGGSGCEGAPAETVWKVPFDGSTPMVVDSDLPVGDVFAMFVDGSRLAMVVGCDGYSSSVILATSVFGGDLLEMITIETGEGLDDIARIHHVEWQADRTLLLITTDGVSVATAVYEPNGELRSRTVEPGTADYTVDTNRLDALDAAGWRIEDRDGFVHAMSTDGSAFLGKPVELFPTPFGNAWPLLMKEDFSGWFRVMADSTDPCVGQLQFVDFATGDSATVAEVRGRVAALSVDDDQLTTQAFCDEAISESFPLTEIEGNIETATFSPDLPTPNPPADTPAGPTAGPLQNDRFGFVVTGPSGDWQEQLPRSQNGDGYVFTNGTSTIRVFGSFDVDGQIAAAPYNAEDSRTLWNPNGFGDGLDGTAALRSYAIESAVVDGGTFAQWAVFAPDRVVVVQADFADADADYVARFVETLTVEIME